MANNILITGTPGVGKTTLLLRIAEKLRYLHPVGFVTREIREGMNRTGFTFESFAGVRGTLAHKEISGRFHVGSYGVNVSGFEDFLRSLPLSSPEAGVVVIDEIGKMECLSPLFRKMVRELMDSPRPVVATVAFRAGGFIKEIKARPDVTLVQVTRQNREFVEEEILKKLQDAGVTLPAV